MWQDYTDHEGGFKWINGFQMKGDSTKRVDPKDEKKPQF